MEECLYTIIRALLQWAGSSLQWSSLHASICILVLYPLACLKNDAILVTIGAIGVPCFFYTVVFIIYHGVHALTTLPSSAFNYITITAKPTFATLGGIITLSYFIHNAITPILRRSNPITRQVSLLLGSIRLLWHSEMYE